MRAALYLRVSTLDQVEANSIANQERELRAVAARLGYEVVDVYSDNGISGAKGRNGRPEFDRLHRDAVRRRFDLVMCWSVDRLGRSVQDLVSFLNEIHASGVNLYLHVQGLDTTTPAGKAMFQMMGVFAEFERAMIRERVLSGMARAKANGTKSGKAIGRPRLDPARREAIRAAYQASGIGLRRVARRFGVSVETVRRVIREPSVMDESETQAFARKLLELVVAAGDDGMELQELVAATGRSAEEIEDMLEPLRAGGYLKRVTRRRTKQ